MKPAKGGGGGDDLDDYVRWVSRTEPKMNCKLDQPTSIVEACQWLAKGKALRDEYFKREAETLLTALARYGPSLKKF